MDKVIASEIIYMDKIIPYEILVFMVQILGGLNCKYVCFRLILAYSDL